MPHETTKPTAGTVGSIEGSGERTTRGSYGKERLPSLPKPDRETKARTVRMLQRLARSVVQDIETMREGLAAVQGILRRSSLGLS